jgi:hypothetical protein
LVHQVEERAPARRAQQQPVLKPMQQIEEALKQHQLQDVSTAAAAALSARAAPLVA